jgi:hypothetical protein
MTAISLPRLLRPPSIDQASLDLLKGMFDGISAGLIIGIALMGRNGRKTVSVSLPATIFYCTFALEKLGSLARGDLFCWRNRRRFPDFSMAHRRGLPGGPHDKTNMAWVGLTDE